MMYCEAFHASLVQLVSQVCGALHAPVGDVKLTDPGLTEGDRDGGCGTAGAEEQNSLAREFYAGLLAGHDHTAPVRIETAHPGILDHHGVESARDASFLVQFVHLRDHSPLVRHGNVEASEL